MAREISRRDFLAAGGAGLTFVVLSSCGLGGGGGSSSGGGGGNVIFSHGPEDSGTLQKQIDRFNAAKHGFQVTWRKAPADTGQYFDQLRTQFQAGGGDIDVISGDVIWPAQFGSNGWVEDLTSRFNKDFKKSDFLPGPTQAVTYQGKVYAVPWFTDLGMFWYRVDLLQKAGISNPPKTFDDVISMGQQTMKATGTKFGFVFQGANYEGGVVDGLEYIWNSGGDALDPKNPKKVTIDSPEAVTGLSAERKFVTSGVTPAAVSTYKEMDAHTAFLNGDSVFMRNWPYVYGLLTKPDQSKIKPEQVQVSQLPVDRSGAKSYECLGGWNLFMNAASKHKDSAWELIKYLAAPEQVKERAIGGGFLSPLVATYSDSEVLSQVPVIKLAKDLAPGVRSRPVSPYYSDLSLKMGPVFNDILKGNSQPDSALKDLQTQMQNIVNKG